MTEGNDVKHSWTGLNSYFSVSPKHALTFLIVGDSIYASIRVRFIANLEDRRSVDAIFNEVVYTWVLKIVTDGQTDSLPNLIKCVVVYCSYSYALWSTSLSAPGITYTTFITYITYITSITFITYITYITYITVMDPTITWLRQQYILAKETTQLSQKMTKCLIYIQI